MRLITSGFLAWIISCRPAFAEEYNLTVNIHGIKHSLWKIHFENSLFCKLNLSWQNVRDQVYDLRII